MAEQLMMLSMGKSRKSNRSSIPPRPPNAWILYRSDKMREIQRERKMSIISKRESCTSTSSTPTSSSSSSMMMKNSKFNYEYNLTPMESSIENNSANLTISTEPSRFRNSQEVERINENSGGANCLQAQISRIVSQMWKNESEEVKERYANLANECKLEHQKLYPNYRYQPKRKRRVQLSTNQSHPEAFQRFNSYQQPNGSYEPQSNAIKRDWSNSSWSPWQNAWDGEKGKHTYAHLPLTLQQNNHNSGSKCPLGGSNTYEKLNRKDGIQNHSFIPHDEQRYSSTSTSTSAGGIPGGEVLSPTRPHIRSNSSMPNIAQTQHYPVQPAYIPDQIPFNSQFLEGRGRTYSEINSSMPFQQQQQQQQQTTAYSSNPQNLVSFTHPTSSTHLYDDIRRISPQSGYTYTGVSSNPLEHPQIHPNNNQRSQPIQNMDLLQDLLATNNTNHYNGSSTFSR